MYLPCGGPCSCHSLQQASYQGDGDGGVVVDGGAGVDVFVVGGGGVVVDGRIVVVVGGDGGVGVEIHFQDRFCEGSTM